MTLDEAADYCQKRAAASGSSFYYSFLFLPPVRRAAITALYAFCREVDDVVDEVRDKTVAATKLAWWRTEVDRLFEGKPTHPVMIAMAPQMPTTAQDRPAMSSSGTKDTAAISTGTTGM